MRGLGSGDGGTAAAFATSGPGTAAARRVGAAADPLARDSARLHRRVDRDRSARPPPGDGPRRARAQAVPLPPALARAARRRQVRADGRVQRGAAADPAPAASRPRAARPPAREGARRDREAARGDVHPRRQRGVRDRERLVRADDPARRPRRDRRQRAPLRVPRQERQAPPLPRSATGGSRGS